MWSIQQHHLYIKLDKLVRPFVAVIARADIRRVFCREFGLVDFMCLCNVLNLSGLDLE